MLNSFWVKYFFGFFSFHAIVFIRMIPIELMTYFFKEFLEKMTISSSNVAQNVSEKNLNYFNLRLSLDNRYEDLTNVGCWNESIILLNVEHLLNTWAYFTNRFYWNRSN